MPTYSILCCIAKNKEKVKSPTPREKFDILGYQPILEDEDRDLVFNSGRIIFEEKHLEMKGVPFLMGFFKTFPEHQKYFKAFKNTPYQDLKSLPVAENHGRKVMDEVKFLVNNINDPIQMKESIWNLTFSHRNRKVRTAQMKDMIFAFVDFVKAELGDEFTAEMEVSWKKFIAFIMAIVEDEESKANTTARNTMEETSALDISNYIVNKV
ncbi:cytoglobin-2 [Biomphalaria pfeifferi]|uniref:Globin n=1 Tax=Biomphalaria pfeifferi TaxID=112525 RepID=A0AAD8B8E7_BIOPF|nr:cytoglobin-2 [Biomphalaria pfeifferi]